jgi:hypothetical protein
MKALIVALIALLAVVYAQTDYTAYSADFICSAPQFGTGIFRGKLLYDWSTFAFQIIFQGNEGYTETYQFNNNRGYKTDDTTGQFAYQYLYKQSTSCPCETTGLQFAMPPLFPAAAEPQPGQSAISGIPYWINPAVGDKSLVNFVGTPTKYTANDQFVIAATKQTYTLTSFFWTSNGVPAGFNINDFQRRTFALQNVVALTPGKTGIVVPSSGCKCGKQMDIVLSLDRSGSISYNQWLLEYQFVQNLITAFTYGPLATNLGIGNWNAKQWITLGITSGTSDSVVNSAVGSMTCCPGASSTSCCCCGTPIGGGLWLGGSMLSESTRGKSSKVLIVLTDGCQNHLWDDTSQTAIQCACASEKACSTNATCVGDITKYYNWVQDNIPGTRIIVVGVGGADTICKDQLLLAAGGDPTNVYNPTDWSQLLTLVQSISATACTADNALCPGCCGICTCGQCIPPTECKSPDACNTGVLDNTGCCTAQPITCDQKPCQYQYCDSTKGCLWDPIECPPDETCTTYVCNNSFVCEGQKKTNPDGSDIPACTTVVVYKCVNDSQCDDKSSCTKDTCENHSCKNTQIVCNPDDKCNSYVCKPSEGCVVTTLKCNDGNNCTVDTCDPLKGCVFTDVSAKCPPPKTSCETVICDKIDGCTTLPLDCTKKGYVAVNCTVPACNESTGCYNQYICAAPPPTSSETFPETVVLVSTLTTAAVAGIVIAAVLLAAGLGGGAAVAIAQVAAGGGAVVTASNPLYAGAGMSGDNPLNQT